MPATFTFDDATENPTQKDEARFRVGDTNGKPQWFASDQFITFQITKWGFDEACAIYAESIGAQCAQLAASVAQRNLKIQYQQRSKAMYELADRIRDLAQPDPATPNTGAGSASMAGTNMWGLDSQIDRCDPNRL